MLTTTSDCIRRRLSESHPVCYVKDVSEGIQFLTNM